VEAIKNRFTFNTKIMKQIIVITDNATIYRSFKSLVSKLAITNVRFSYYCSPGNRALFQNEIEEIEIAKSISFLIENCQLLLSLHCQQLFPVALITKLRSVNIHPGLNPYNRGWYPHMYAIINGKPTGATIHEIDSTIDRGAIIVQKQVEVYTYDTSQTLYKRVLDTELELLEKHLPSIIDNTYTPVPITEKGNYNSKKDFFNLCEIDMQEVGTFEQFYNKLRALSYKGYKNAWFIDKEGTKIFLNLNIERE